MTAHERKNQSEKLLKSLGIVLKDDLPPIEEENEVTLRTANEVAERILILTYLNCLATDSSLQQPIMMFLIHEGLWDKATDVEKALFHKSPLTEEELTIIFWRSESVWLLLWVINKVDQLALPEKEADLLEIFPYLPGFLEPTKSFIDAATMLSSSEILDQCDFIFRLNWAMKEDSAQLSSTALNVGIAHERYFAINWVTRMRERWEDS
ncbi:MAG TPA: DUF4272 domain-containing protein [Chryseolinea sp.]|nr:DUF4272 domain-containing protein [Chryseolinea sp.]